MTNPEKRDEQPVEQQERGKAKAKSETERVQQEAAEERAEQGGYQ